MRYLLIPENNPLSNFARCIATRETLVNKGHEILIALAQKHSQFLLQIDADLNVLSDIQEIDGAPSPTTAWFKHRGKTQ